MCDAAGPEIGPPHFLLYFYLCVGSYYKYLAAINISFGIYVIVSHGV